MAPPRKTELLMGEELVVMSTQELDRLAVIRRVLERRIDRRAQRLDAVRSYRLAVARPDVDADS